MPSTPRINIGTRRIKLHLITNQLLNLGELVSQCICNSIRSADSDCEPWVSGSLDNDNLNLLGHNREVKSVSLSRVAPSSFAQHAQKGYEKMDDGQSYVICAQAPEGDAN